MPLFICRTTNGVTTASCSILNGARSSALYYLHFTVFGGINQPITRRVQGIYAMPITFTPQPGTVLMCDFSSGFVAPEMNKVRHVVVVSPRRRRNAGCCIVVPISTVAPNPVEGYHLRIPANKYSCFKKDTDVWAKGDMVAHVSFQRLDRVLCDGKWSTPTVSFEDLNRIQNLVWEALGCPAPAFTLELAAESAEIKT